MSGTVANAPVVIDHAEYAITAPSPDLIQYDESRSCVTFTVRPGDQAPYDRKRARPYERAELINLSAFPFGKPVTISYFQYIAPGSAATRPAIIGQIHNTGPADRPQPFAAMRVDGQSQYLVTYSGGGIHDPRKSTVRWSAPLVLGRWVHWTWQYTPSRTNTTLRIWRDGTPIFDAPLQLGGYTGPRGPYWQFGIYRSKDRTTMRVAYAAMRVRPGPPTIPPAVPPRPSCPVKPLP